jgi:REP element-mobilizing transposase RayT
MTPPRQILPGATYLVTRRCSERRFFLRPSDATNNLFRFVLGVATERFGICLHAYCVLSNHYHLVLTDPLGRLPDFQQYLDSLTARAVNAALGHREAFWDRDSYNVVPLETAEDILAKIVYVLANPVAAGLVRHASEWPGSWSDPRSAGRAPISVDRPEAFFRKTGPLPASVELQLHAPPGLSGDASFAEAVTRALAAEEDRIASQRGREGRAFLGTAWVRAQKWWASPSRSERLGKPTPRVAGRRRWVRDEALARLREFWGAYREALVAWCGGMREVLFPPGTWAMRVRHGARCEAAP